MEAETVDGQLEEAEVDEKLTAVASLSITLLADSSSTVCPLLLIVILYRIDLGLPLA